jgi:hypothetical protein
VTRSLILGEIRPLFPKTIDTVVTDTPACLATSVIVIFFEDIGLLIVVRKTFYHAILAPFSHLLKV